MLYVLALFAALVAANQKTRKCLSTSLGGALQKGFEASNMMTKMSSLKTQMDACGVSQSFTAMVEYEKMYYAHRSMTTAGSLAKLMTEMKKEFGIPPQREFFLTYKAPTSLVPSNANWKFEVFNDDDLKRAVDFSMAYGFALKFQLEKIFDFRDPQMLMVSSKTTEDNRDTGVITGRTMKFTKKMDETTMRFFYVDNFGVRGTNKWCRWELMINGKSCTTYKAGNVGMSGSMLTIAGENDLVSATVAGYCDGLPATKAGETHLLTVVLTNSGAGTNCITGWQMGGAPRNGDYIPGQNYLLEAEEMLPGYQMVQFEQAIKQETLNVGRLGARQLTFEKQSKDTYMRVFWKDNIRKTSNNGCFCRWEVQFNNANCGNPAGGIAAHIHANAGDNDHFPKAIVGYCKLAKGTHTTSIYINRSHSWCDCHTGWGAAARGDNYVMEVREIGLSHERISWMQKYNLSDGRDYGYVNQRTLSFTKLDDNTSMRLLYSDNLRVYGTNRKCQWEIYIDDTHCASGKIAMSAHTTQNDNDYQPGMVVGYCHGLKKGGHSMRIYVNSNDGQRNHDCLTGGHWGTPNNFVLEAEEASPVENK